jgi:hypothetical protein
LYSCCNTANIPVALKVQPWKRCNGKVRKSREYRAAVRDIR